MSVRSPVPHVAAPIEKRRQVAARYLVIPERSSASDTTWTGIALLIIFSRSLSISGGCVILISPNSKPEASCPLMATPFQLFLSNGNGTVKISKQFVVFSSK